MVGAQALILALVSALAAGIADFLGGLVARRTGPFTTAVMSQGTAALGFGVIALTHPGTPQVTDWFVAAGSGVLAGAGSIFLFRGLSRGRAAVVAPLSAIGAAAVPAAAGLLRGERLTMTMLLALLLAGPAIVALSSVSGPGSTHRGILDGAFAGLGLGGSLAVLTGLSGHAGPLPLAMGSLTAVVSVSAAARLRSEHWLPDDRAGWAAAAIGPIMVTGLGSFVLAVRSGPLVVVSVVAALYPAVTVLLALTVLRERMTRLQALGLLLSGVVLIAIASG
ncbi:DMT family transporter [Nocardioides sp. AN3]